MIGLLVVKPLLLLGGVGYPGYRVFYKPLKSHLDAQRDGEFAGSGGITMKRCPECNTYIRGDAIEMEKDLLADRLDREVRPRAAFG